MCIDRVCAEGEIRIPRKSQGRGTADTSTSDKGGSKDTGSRQGSGTADTSTSGKGKKKKKK